MPNRLASETSPYLKQHENNPVDWFPWGEDAITKARSENKPILLSIGYSSCHWCHVMAHESFEDPEIARIMNERFVNIKVDREERPDLDQIYQNVAQLMTRSGGWPLTVFLTPQLKPYFGGTYFPPDDRYGRPGFKRVLLALSDAYRDEPESVESNAVSLMSALSRVDRYSSEGKSLPDPSSLGEIARRILESVDWRNGWLGSAPKFPNPMVFSFLWRMGICSDVAQGRDATLLTLRKMVRGGIFDHLGGGFSRYSVDAEWVVPHFEKMLYDNGLLLKLISEVLLTYKLAGAEVLRMEEKEELVHAVAATVEWVLRERRPPEGGFFAAQDADSEGEEGKFFVWTPSLIREALSRDEAEAFILRYGVTPQGNFENGTTVLCVAEEIEEVASKMGKTPEEICSLLDSARLQLFTIRQGRVAPGTDTKILASWNGLMISGMVWASIALRQNARTELADRAIDAARAAFELVVTRMASEDWRLKGSFQGGEARFNAYLDDYAFLAMAALDLARVEESPGNIQRYLDASKNWVDVILKHFRDPSGPGYFFTSDDHEPLIHRPKSLFDQAIPSGTAVALECMAALAEMRPEELGECYGQELEDRLSSLYGLAQKHPLGFGELLGLALLVWQGPVILSGERAALVCSHPHLFQKQRELGLGARILVCHRKSCLLAPEELHEAHQLAFSKVAKLA